MGVVGTSRHGRPIFKSVCKHCPACTSCKRLILRFKEVPGNGGIPDAHPHWAAAVHHVDQAAAAFHSNVPEPDCACYRDECLDQPPPPPPPDLGRIEDTALDFADPAWHLPPIPEEGEDEQGLPSPSKKRKREEEDEDAE